jgi:outer membrane protein
MLLRNRVLRMIPLVLTVFAATCALYAEANAEGKIGYIDSYRIRKEFAEFKEAQGKFDKEVITWQAELDSMRQDLEAAAEEYQRQRLILSEEARRRKEDELRLAETKFQETTNTVFGPDGQAERRNAELVKPILDKINAVLEKVAIENNYDYIFDAVDGNIAYAKKDFDLTDLVLEELNSLD